MTPPAWQVLDAEESLGVTRTIPIGLRGELYKMQVNIKYPQASCHAT